MDTKQGYIDPQMPFPYDIRSYKATQAEILTIPEGARYDGMEIYARDEDTWYQFIGGVQDGDLTLSRGAKVPAVENRYADLATMYADQASQSTGKLQYVTDASADPDIVSGYGYYDYLGTTAGDLTDYIRVSDGHAHLNKAVLDATEVAYTTTKDNEVAANTAASHAEEHTVASHSDTTATGAQLDELTDGSETTLHSHAESQGGHIIEDEGTPVTQRDTINFVGDGVTVTDDGKSVVTIPGGGALEILQTLTVTNANATDALALNAEANVIVITLDAALTQDWAPSAITGIVVNRNYTWVILKVSDNGVDMTATTGAFFDDDIDPFVNLIDISTTQQRAVVPAVGLKSTAIQFAAMILTGSAYAE